jgi:putative tryptophan/tyrosine transport system substrate-binding protein
MRRRDFIQGIAGSTLAWPIAVFAQQQAVPVVGFVNGRSPETSARVASAFRKGLSEAGYVEGENVTVDYHWLDGRYERLPSLMADLVHRGVAVIATPGSNPAALAARAATKTIPIVFGVGADPMTMGLVASLARPGGNATGISSFVTDVDAKRLALLHELVPKAVRIAVLVNPDNTSTAEAARRDISEAARAIGLQIEFLNASTSREIEMAFATMVRDRVDALFVTPDGFLISRRVQLAMFAARYGTPSAYATREDVEAGGLMSYGIDLLEMYRQVGAISVTIYSNVLVECPAAYNLSPPGAAFWGKRWTSALKPFWPTF